MADDIAQQLSGLSDDELDEEIRTLQAIDASLAEESETIASIAEKAAKELEDQTAADRAIMAEEGSRLEELEEQADEEENSGQIGNIQDQIKSM